MSLESAVALIVEIVRKPSRERGSFKELKRRRSYAFRVLLKYTLNAYRETTELCSGEVGYAVTRRVALRECETRGEADMACRLAARLASHAFN